MNRTLDQEETALLIQINEGISAQTRSRFNALAAKRQQETISPRELDELIWLTDRIEQHDVRRLTALEALAQRRSTTLTDLMDSLGIPPPTYA